MQRGVFIMTIMAASSREGKTLRDVVFAAGAAAREAAARYGEEKVINATVGCYAGEDENWLVCLSSNSYTALCR